MTFRRDCCCAVHMEREKERHLPGIEVIEEQLHSGWTQINWRLSFKPVFDTNGVWGCLQPCMCVWFSCTCMCMHLTAQFVGGCVSGGRLRIVLCVVMCRRGEMIMACLSEVCLPLRPEPLVGKSSLTCFLCLPLALSGWENTNRGAAFVRH